MPRSIFHCWSGPARGLILIAAIYGGMRFWRSEEAKLSQPAPWPSLVVDANTVPIPVLEALPGLGPALAGRIVDGRANHPFTTLVDLDQRVKGIGPVKSAALAPFFRFPTPR